MTDPLGRGLLIDVTYADLDIEPGPSPSELAEFSPPSRRSERQAATERRQHEVSESIGSLHAFVDLVDRVRTERVRGLGVLAFLNLADVVTTSVFLRMGAAEGNPALAPVAMHWWLLLLFKVVIMATVAKFVLAAPARSTLSRRLVLASIVYYTAVVAWNLITIIRL